MGGVEQTLGTESTITWANYQTEEKNRHLRTSPSLSPCKLLCALLGSEDFVLSRFSPGGTQDGQRGF